LVSFYASADSSKLPLLYNLVGFYLNRSSSGTVPPSPTSPAADSSGTIALSLQDANMRSVQEIGRSSYHVCDYSDKDDDKSTITAGSCPDSGMLHFDVLLRLVE
jgi:hypothetical protein